MDLFMCNHCFTLMIQKEIQESEAAGCCNVGLNGNQLNGSSGSFLSHSQNSSDCLILQALDEICKNYCRQLSQY